MNTRIGEYLSGRNLIGDNFSIEEIEKWFQEEEEGYADLGSKDKESYQYSYHNMNSYYGFSYLPANKTFKHLGIGSAYGDEVLPIIKNISEITIIEPSEQLRSKKIQNIIPTYVKPNINGKLDFSDENFSLITCFGTLHHIPNVTFVINELIRVLEKDGYLLIREPIRTMGNWEYPREGLTKNERGIPLKFFRDFFKRDDIEIIKESLCNPTFFYKIARKLFGLNFNSPNHFKFDSLLSNILSWNTKYHPTNIFEKIGPNSVFYVIRKCK